MQHEIINGDARNLKYIADGSVQLVLTSPPYWNLKSYKEGKGQLGIIEDYDVYLKELNKVLKECYRILEPGGRMVCVAGDVCLSRRKYGRHMVMPLHSDIQIMGRRAGFDNLNPILWYKITNAKYEANTRSSVLGKPYEPNGIIKNDMEYILMLRKPGAYRSPSEEQRERSRIPAEEYNKWFTQLWTLPGASTKHHPAPYPYELAQRLIRMFSFYGDVVVDPFCGSGTTMIAAADFGRSSIGIEIEKEYCDFVSRRFQKECKGQALTITTIKHGKKVIESRIERKDSHDNF